MSDDRDVRKEPAEGSRETVDEALHDQDREGQQQGITNRPRAAEEDEQAQLPPRGRKKDDGATPAPPRRQSQGE